MNKNITIQELYEASKNHPYYCCDNNYYSNKANLDYPDFPSFMAEFKEADVDMNLCFRWDLFKDCDDDECEAESDDVIEKDKQYYLEIFIIKQRKGIFTPIHIDKFEEKDIPALIEYLEPHISKLKEIWRPFEF